MNRSPGFVSIENASTSTVRVGAEHAGDHRTVRMRLGLLGRQAAGADQLADERVVLGQLLELVVADEVRARIADVADVGDLTVDQRDRHRRAHAGSGLVGALALVDAAVRVLDQLHDSLVVDRPVVRRVAKGRRREVRGDFAGLRPAHAVRDREQRRFADVVVLVPAPAAAGVSDGCRARQRHRSNLKSVSPMRITSPGDSLRAPVRRAPFTYVPFVEPMSSIQTPSRRGSILA